MGLRDKLNGVGREDLIYGLCWLAITLGVVLIVLVLGHGPEVLSVLREGEDVGQRLRRECESIAREVDDGTWSEGVRERYIRACIDRRGR